MAHLTEGLLTLHNLTGDAGGQREAKKNKMLSGGDTELDKSQRNLETLQSHVPNVRMYVQSRVNMHYIF